MKRAALIVCVLLSGCTEYLVAAGAVEAQAIRDRQMYNDGKAVAIARTTCDISVGAFSRMQTGAVKCGIGQICDLNLLECIPGIRGSVYTGSQTAE